jgi:hypothetical protein
MEELLEPDPVIVLAAKVELVAEAVLVGVLKPPGDSNSALVDEWPIRLSVEVVVGEFKMSPTLVQNPAKSSTVE